MIPLLPIVAAVVVGGAMAISFRSDQRGRKGQRLVPGKKRPGLPNRLKSQELADTARKGGVLVAADASKDDPDNDYRNRIAASVGTVVFSVAGSLLFPPLSWLALPFLAYGSYPIFRSAARDLVYDRRVATPFLDAVIFGGLITTGNWGMAGALSAALLISSLLITRTEARAHGGIADLYGEQSRTAWLCDGDHEIEVPIEKIFAGNIIAVHAGGGIPVDGIIVDGCGTIDERLLTGEALPVEREPGHKVYANTQLLSGTLHVRVEQCGDQTVASEISAALDRTLEYRQQLQWQWVGVMDRLTLPILAAGAIGWAVGGVMTGIGVVYAIGLPLTMRIAVPAALFMSLRRSLSCRAIIKDGRILERLSQVDTVVFDKTGTLTLEHPTLVHIHRTGFLGPDDILKLAAAAEYRQTHPIAKAIVAAAETRRVDVTAPDKIEVVHGFGLTTKIADSIVQIGSERFMQSQSIVLPDRHEALVDRAHGKGHSFVWLAVDGMIEGALEFQPTLRPEVRSVVSALRRRGKEIHILSGDHSGPTRRLAEALKINDFQAEMHPSEKADYVRSLQDNGHRVCFVGDGVNDSVALGQADVAISLAGATSVAVDAAGVVLMSGTLRPIPDVFEIADAFSRKVQTSIVGAGAADIALVGGVLLGYLTFGGTVIASYLVNGLVVFNASAAEPRNGIKVQIQTKAEQLMTPRQMDLNR